MLWTALIGLFLIAHGLIHVAVYVPHPAADAPFDPTHSWLLRSAWVRPIALALASTATAMFVISGIAIFAHQDWWKAAAVVGAAISLALVVLFFHPWLSLAVAINAAILWVLTQTDWPSADRLGW